MHGFLTKHFTFTQVLEREKVKIRRKITSIYLNPKIYFIIAIYLLPYTLFKKLRLEMMT